MYWSWGLVRLTTEKLLLVEVGKPIVIKNCFSVKNTC